MKNKTFENTQNFNTNSKSAFGNSSKAFIKNSCASAKMIFDDVVSFKQLNNVTIVTDRKRFFLFFNKKLSSFLNSC